ncbi:MAG: phosphoglycolate phosphatase [Rhodanobacter denitrificans]|uniref:Phosphoglycolate phosphatase n=1 Tax=Rhodanobacter denitrificans TaxID=666685 RepID=A0A2W5K2T6_9GAMM|nr:MAG: phosphoglycolate phosphatase [Rhodanobacter denitrificans]
MTASPQAVLFDLDGTLVDSAPDLIGALQALCVELGEAPPDADAVRIVVSAGGRAMLRRGLPGFDEAAIEHHLPRFLALYAGRIAQETQPYAGVVELLDWLEHDGIAWGIVTNKPGWLARPLVEQLGWANRCAALVSGDCLSTKKPDPEPVLHACAQAGADPARTWFVGDDLRDIQAGRAAGARTFAAAWGYLDGGDPAAWEADVVVATPPELTRLLGRG